MPREFKEVTDDLRSDGALRDFYIRAANRADWNAVLCRVRRNWKANRFTVDGESRELPQSFEAIERLRQKANPCLNILVDGAYVNCHFFWHEEIEFDFRPEDFARRSDGQRSVDSSRGLSMWLANPASSPTRTLRTASSIGLNLEAHLELQRRHRQR
jgi:hypothetical protein